MTYSDARRYIESLQARGWRLGLDRMEVFLDRLDNPQVGLQAFHVAGTNGKGSVTAMIAAALAEAGYKSGAFFSPYVYQFEERIQVDGRLISRDDVARLTAELKPIADDMVYEEVGGPTEFEFKTAMAFVYWREQGVDYAAVEVGMGGRLDATNVIEAPLCAVITEIGLDHQQYLGETIEKIALEKAGILKPGRPAVTGVTDDAAYEVIRRRAEELQCPLQRVKADSFLELNRALAAAALDVGLPRGAAWRVPQVSLPGRLEVVSTDPPVVFDGAHNEQAVSAVLRHVPGSVVCVYSCATGHPPLTSLVRELCREVFVAAMNHPRGLPAEELQPTHSSVADAVRAGLEALQPRETLLVLGSFFLLAEARQALRDLTSVR